MSFIERINAPCYGIQQWRDLDALWDALRNSEGWYAYFVDKTPPQTPILPQQLNRLIKEIDVLLKKEHEYDYCGIVYVDDFAAPQLVKIYDPNSLGSSCGHGGQKHLPRWILTRDPPAALDHIDITPENRKRRWNRLFCWSPD